MKSTGPGLWFALCALMFGLVACASDPGGGGGGGDDDDDCGDDTCQSDESVRSCPEDCEGPTCGDSKCEGNEATTCPADCTTGPTCGDQKCEGNETTTCPGDCQVCGNNQCEGNEASTCPQDCDVDPVCNNNVCESGETTSCPTDCPASVRLQNNSSYTIYNFWIAACGSPNWGPDQTGAGTIPIGSSFTVNRIPPGCYYFRASTYNDAYYWQTASPVQLAPSAAYPWTLVN